MSDPDGADSRAEQAWRAYLTTGRTAGYTHQAWFESPRLRPLIRRLPKDPRCRICYYPFAGVGGRLVQSLLGIGPSKMNPQLCNLCERFAEKHRGGTEIEVSLLFADVRGSTGLAERMSTLEFSQLISRFYRAATKVLYRRNALVEKLIGDAVTGFFVPAFAGPRHAQAAVEAGAAILEATGHDGAAGPWIPVGIGIHTGAAYVGAVGLEDGGVDIAVLGDTPNTAARLASVAGAGEILISDAARRAARLDPKSMTPRRLELKGRAEPVEAWVLAVNLPERHAKSADA